MGMLLFKPHRHVTTVAQEGGDSLSLTLLQESISLGKLPLPLDEASSGQELPFFYHHVLSGPWSFLLAGNGEV